MAIAEPYIAAPAARFRTTRTSRLSRVSWADRAAIGALIGVTVLA
ncbi:MAG: hypothetical protein QOK06_906, partial [Acidimicrobiaceae bacterium]